MDEDLPLWLLEKVRVERKWKVEKVVDYEEQEMRKCCDDDPDKIRRMEAKQRRAKHESQVYEQALRFAKAEDDRMRPDRTFPEATSIRSLGRRDTLMLIERQKEMVTNAELYKQDILEFAATVPQDALQAKVAVDAEATESKQDMESMRNDLAQPERRLAEHGNDAE